MNANLTDILSGVMQTAMGVQASNAPAANNPLGSLLAGVLGGAAPEQQPKQAGGNAAWLALLPLVMQFVQASGGIDGLLKKLQASGLGDAANSWVGTGDNAAMTPDAAMQLMGADTVAAFAQKTGMPEEQVGAGVAQLLPELINQLSPGGAVASNNGAMLQMGLSALQGMMSKG